MTIQGRFEAIKKDLFNGNQKAFADAIGVAPSVIANVIGPRQGNPSYEVISKLCANANISADWLLSGRGDMLRTVPTSPITPTTPTQPTVPTAVHASNLKDAIPLVTEQAAAGFGSADFRITEADVKDYYVIPKFKHCKVDFMIELAGSSMYPKYNSGDVVACTILHESRFIQWNKCHIIATAEQGLLCKRLRKSEQSDCITAVSDNRDYPPFDIPTSEITGIAIVVGVIRLE